MYVVWAQSILAGSQQFLHVRAVLLQYPLAPGAFLLPLGDRNPTCWASRISLYRTTGLPSIVYELQPWVVLMKNHTNLGRFFHLLIIQLSLLPLLNFLIGRFQKISIPYHGRLLGFPKGRGGSRLWNSEGMGGIYDWKSEGMGEFHRWDFWSRKCRVSSLKTLLLWTFVVRK